MCYCGKDFSFIQCPQNHSALSVVQFIQCRCGSIGRFYRWHIHCQPVNFPLLGEHSCSIYMLGRPHQLLLYCTLHIYMYEFFKHTFLYSIKPRTPKRHIAVITSECNTVPWWTVIVESSFEYWVTVSFALFIYCCTAVNFDCKPPFFHQNTELQQAAPPQHCLCLHLWQLHSTTLCYVWTRVLCF